VPFQEVPPGADVAVIDTREYALVITIDKNGVADVTSCNVDRAYAARLLRLLADSFATQIKEAQA
jgi:hypothetical protein